MGDLIDRDALGVGPANPKVFENPAYAAGWNALLRIINQAPVVDAVPVVRCKKCIHSEEVGVLPEGVLYCNTNDMPIPEDGCCNQWKRKEDKQ